MASINRQTLRPPSISTLESPTHLFDLPTELFENVIFKKMDAASLFAATYTCKKFYTVLHPKQISEDFGAMAIKPGYLELLKWLVETYNYPLDRQTACSDAAQVGDWDILNWLIERGCWIVPKTYECAAENNHVHILKELKKRSIIKLNSEMFNSAALGGSWEVLRWFIDQHCPVDQATACAFAAQGGHLDVLKWLQNEHGCLLNGFTFTLAALGNNLAALEFLRLNKCPLTEIDSVACHVGSHGSIELLEWFIQHYNFNQTMSADAVRYMASSAATKGHLHFLKYLRQNNYSIGHEIVRSAAYKGHLPILEWAVQIHGNACINAITGLLQEASNLNTLKWLKEKGYSLRFDLVFTRTTDLKIIEWIINEYPENLPFYKDATLSKCRRAAENGDLRMIKWFYHKGFFIEKNICIKAANKAQHLEVVEWLNTIPDQQAAEPSTLFLRIALGSLVVIMAMFIFTKIFPNSLKIGSTKPIAS